MKKLILALTVIIALLSVSTVHAWGGFYFQSGYGGYGNYYSSYGGYGNYYNNYYSYPSYGGYYGYYPNYYPAYTGSLMHPATYYGGYGSYWW